MEADTGTGKYFLTIHKNNLKTSEVAELKEVFMLFDRDEDGVLSFQELQLVMKSMGQRPSGVKKVSYSIMIKFCSSLFSLLPII